MTFAQLREIVRREIIVDTGTDAYEDTTIDDVLWNSAYEIAATLGFPRVIDSEIETVEDGTQVTAPADALKVHALIINGFDAEEAPIRRVLTSRYGVSGPVDYYNFDPRRGQTIEIAPPSNYAGSDSLIEYTQSLTKPNLADIADADVWGGMMPQFHYVVAYRAGVKLFDMDERQDDPAYQVWAARANEGIAALAAHLNNADYSMLLLGSMARSSAGEAA